MKETLVKYLAGILDADGSLSFEFTKYEKAEDAFFLKLCLSLASSDAVDSKGFIDRLPEKTGMGHVHRYGKAGQFKSWKVHKRASLEMILPRLIKHMVIKGKHWQWLLDKWREQRGGATVTAEMREQLTAASKQSRIENRGPVKPKNHPTWAWLAGYLDGDGWYRRTHVKCGVYKGTQYQQWRMNVGVVAHKNDAHVLEFIQRAHGGIIQVHGQTESVLVWVRNLGPRDSSFALRFLPNLAKHSRLKRDKIDQIISHHRQRLNSPSVREHVSDSLTGSLSG
jgi:hypothetical protein